MRKEGLTVQVQQRPEKTTMSTRVREEVSHQFVDDGGEGKMNIEQTNVLKTSPETEIGTCVDEEAPGAISTVSLAPANAGKYESRRQANAGGIGCSALHPNTAPGRLARPVRLDTTKRVDESESIIIHCLDRLLLHFGSSNEWISEHVGIGH